MSFHTRAVRACTKQGDGVYAVMVSWKVKKDSIDKFIELSLMDAQGSVMTEPGCRRFDVVQDAKQPEKFAYCEIYDNEEAFQLHMQTKHFKKFKDTIGSLVEGKEKVSFCRNVFPKATVAGWGSKNELSTNDAFFQKGSLQVIHAPKHVKVEMVDNFIKEIVADAEASCDQEPGCLRFDVFQNIEDPGEIFLYEVYANPDAFQYHMGTPHIKVWQEATKDMYDDSKQDEQESNTCVGRNVWPPDNWGWSVY